MGYGWHRLGSLPLLIPLGFGRCLHGLAGSRKLGSDVVVILYCWCFRICRPDCVSPDYFFGIIA